MHFTHEQLQQMKRIDRIIGDYNSEGFDSVESEDFDPGYGCVVADVEKELKEPPPVPEKRSPDEVKRTVEAMRYWLEPEAEKVRKEDEFLSKYGVSFGVKYDNEVKAIIVE